MKWKLFIDNQIRINSPKGSRMSHESRSTSLSNTLRWLFAGALIGVILGSITVVMIRDHHFINFRDFASTIKLDRLSEYKSLFKRDDQQHVHSTAAMQPIPYESFTLVVLSSVATPTDCILPLDMCDVPSETFDMQSKGSGVIVGHGLGTTQILTAGHVCQSRNYSAIVFEDMPYTYDSISEIEIIDFYGNSRPAIIVDVDEVNDLCLLMTVGKWAPVVDVAEGMPSIGSRVYNMAAPMGIFSAGMVLMFDGYYSGEDYVGDVFFTIPAYPGSSGSAVLNGDGEIISVIHSATVGFSHIAIGNKLEAIHEIIENNSLVFYQ